MLAAGIVEKSESYHDNLYNSAVLMTLDPTLIRADQRRAVKLFSINGVNLDPANQTVTLGRKLVAQTAEITVAAIRQKTSSR
jgi:creatinine amidohydrolase/Fe(II)-dependent formamide hydrolase-like protein